MDSNKVPRTIRLLQRAEGYLELDLPDRAIGELNAIVDAGPFEPAVALLRGEALKSQGFDTLAGGPDQFARFIATETAKWNEAVKAAGLKK